MSLQAINNNKGHVLTSFVLIKQFNACVTSQAWIPLWYGLPPRYHCSASATVPQTTHKYSTSNKEFNSYLKTSSLWCYPDARWLQACASQTDTCPGRTWDDLEAYISYKDIYYNHYYTLSQSPKG